MRSSCLPLGVSRHPLGEAFRVLENERLVIGVSRKGSCICESGNIYKDLIMDDKGIVLNIKDRGLVVISGCAHAGIVNTVRHAQKITGVDKIYCVMGGFHLIGPGGEPAEHAARTIEEMNVLDPEVIVPCHCTGDKPTHEFEKAFPASFVLNASGTKIHL